MIADRLLSRLESVKQTGPGRWIARCPNHDDRKPSLSIREEGERVLIHDFAGCHIESVLCAVGLTFADLYPEKPLSHHIPRERRSFNPSDVLSCCAEEITIAAIIATDILGGKPVSETDRERLWTAAERLTSAAEVAHGRC